ncbi:MAG: two-component regulator propeller domain-containing protein [Acidobacteriota bacterium]
MRKLPCALLLLLVPRLALALDPSRAVTQYRLDAWTTRTGLPVMSVLSLLQDRAGHLWIGTQEGLARFDGVTFQHFKVGETPGLAGNYISALFEDRGGRIWAGTDAGDLSYFDGARFASIPRDGPLRGQVAGFAEDPGGDLFVAFRGVGLRRLEGRRLVPVADREGRTIERLGALAPGGNGEIWAAGEDRLFRYAQGTWSRFALPRPSGRLVTALAVGAGGEILLSQDDPTVQRLRLQGRELVSAAPDRLFPAPVRALRFDRARTLWIGTETGLSRWRQTPGSAPEPVARIPEAAVNVLSEDREGGLWIGTNNQGLLRLTADEALPFGTAEGLPHPNTWNVFSSTRGDLWVTTSGGLARIVDDRVERIAIEGLPGEDVVALAERRDGSL